MKESGDRVTDHTSCVVYDKHLHQAVNSELSLACDGITVMGINAY